MGREKSSTGQGKYYERLKAASKTLPESLLKLLIRQKYHMAGGHSAAKLCRWAKSMLTGGEGCYKHKFYGIASHRCLQCTPSLLFCNHSCVFCWRFIPEKNMVFDDMPKKGFKWDAPADIVDGLIEAQREIISGFGGNARVSPALYEEALSPKHAAISLTGEPMIYPYLEGLVREFHKRKMTTFIVTNGTFPERVEQWGEYPTQFYVSMVASDKETYKRAIRPISLSLWEKYNRMLEMMPDIGRKTRTVLRMTLARGVNDSNLEGYARQIVVAQPHYVEVKSMVFVGGARAEGRGLGLNSMLRIDEVEKIAKAISEKTGYIICDRHLPSRVVLLCRDKEAEEKRRIAWQ